MTKSKHTKRALLASSLSVLLCLTMLIGSTFAWFTDTASTAVNTIQAGSLDVALEMKNAEGEWVTAEGQTLSFKKAAGGVNQSVLWEPGATYELPTLRIRNNGSLALKYKIVISGLTGDAKLLEVIDFTYGDLDVNAEGYLLAGENTDPITIKGHMQESAGNEYQGLSIEDISITVYATQHTYEHDSFGNEYDKDTLYPSMGKGIREDLNDPNIEEVLAGENINLNSAIFKEPNGNITYIIPDGKTLNLNGHSIIRPDGGSGSGLAVSAKTTATVKNGTVFAEGDMKAIDIGEGATVTFNNMTFKGHGNNILTVRAKGTSENDSKTTIIFEDCEFINAPVVVSGRDGATEIDIQFINCSFSGTYKMYDENGIALTDKYGNTHYTSFMFQATSSYLIGDILFEDCTIDFDAAEATSKKEAIEMDGFYDTNKLLDLTLKNVVINGQNIIPAKLDLTRLNFFEEGHNEYVVNGIAVNYDGSAK